eukprot:4311456-Prymnesium_polylepis.1
MLLTDERPPFMLKVTADMRLRATRRRAARQARAAGAPAPWEADTRAPRPSCRGVLARAATSLAPRRGDRRYTERSTLVHAGAGATPWHRGWMLVHGRRHAFLDARMRGSP